MSGIEKRLAMIEKRLTKLEAVSHKQPDMREMVREVASFVHRVKPQIESGVRPAKVRVSKEHMPKC